MSAANGPVGAANGPVTRRITGRTVYRNAWMTVREDAVERPDGSRGVYGVVDKPDFALVVPAEPGGFHLVEQYRYPVGGRYWEFPQGSWSEPAGGRGAEELAAAELREETGLTAGTMRHLGRVHVAYGYASQGCHIFLATDLVAGPPAREASESDLVHRFVTHAELRQLVADGSFTDAVSLAALTLLDGRYR
ncbi:NUDIX hydrolase [Micromonospora sp. NBRC 110038]|uniref:NUDIX domain-containing protein n=1 Tax=Micromonospora sp. NBRC 110038 TaxID=1550034 RepID=UPI001E4E2AEE|nr:NUDIX hydrolase [Micromonospora sp. NBRC 110038]